MKHTYPPQTIADDCVLVQLRTTDIPYIVGLLEEGLSSGYWTDDSYYAGYNAIARSIAAMTTNCAQDIVNSVDRLYRLVDSIFNGTTYSLNASQQVQPAIPAFPKSALQIQAQWDGDEPYPFLFAIANSLNGLQNILYGMAQSTPLPPQLGRTSLGEILAAIQAQPADSTPLLAAMASNLQTLRGLTQQNICCDNILPPTVITGPISTSDACIRFQSFYDAVVRAMQVLNSYFNGVVIPDANTVQALVNRAVSSNGFTGISGYAAKAIVNDYIGAENTDWGAFFTDDLKSTMVNMLQSAQDATQAAITFDTVLSNWSGLTNASVREVWKEIGHDLALISQVYATSNTIVTTGYNSDYCAPTGGTNYILVDSVLSYLVNTNDMSTLAEHSYLELAGSYTAYIGRPTWETVSGFDTRALYRAGQYTGGLNDPKTAGYYDTDWGGVQLLIDNGPDDVTVYSWNNTFAPIQLSKTSYTTLPAGTSNFLIYSPTSLVSYQLRVIFP